MTTPTPITSAFYAPTVVTLPATAYFGLLALRLALLVTFAFADVIFIKGSADVVLGEAEAMSWFVAIVLTGLSLYLMLKSGFLFREAHDLSADPRFSLVLIGGWAVLGTAIVVLRFNAAGWTTQAIAIGGAAPVADETGKSQGVAILLALIYISSGTLAWFEGKHLFNPVAQAFLIGRVKRGRVLKATVAQQGVVAGSAEDLERGRGNLEGVNTARAAVENGLRSIATDLMAEARVRISIHLGDPAATGMTAQPPLNPTTTQESNPS